MGDRAIARRSALFASLLFSLLGGAAGCMHPSATQQAMSYARQHREDRAVATLRAELDAHPDDLEARGMLVRMLAAQGDMHAAEGEVKAMADRLPPGDPRPWIELGHAKEMAHDFEGALASYDEAASQAPNDPAGPREGGMRAARWGEVEEAAPRLREAVRRGDHDPETWHALGLVSVHLHDLDGAYAAYRNGLVADPRSAENWLGLATVAALKEDAAGALQAYDAIASLRPKFAAAQLGRAWALAKLGRRADAATALDRAEELGAPAASVRKQRAALAE